MASRFAYATGSIERPGDDFPEDHLFRDLEQPDDFSDPIKRMGRKRAPAAAAAVATPPPSLKKRIDIDFSNINIDTSKAIADMAAVQPSGVGGEPQAHPELENIEMTEEYYEAVGKKRECDPLTDNCESADTHKPKVQFGEGGDYYKEKPRAAAPVVTPAPEPKFIHRQEDDPLTEFFPGNGWPEYHDIKHGAQDNGDYYKREAVALPPAIKVDDGYCLDTPDDPSCGGKGPDPRTHPHVPGAQNNNDYYNNDYYKRQFEGLKKLVQSDWGNKEPQERQKLERINPNDEYYKRDVVRAGRKHARTEAPAATPIPQRPEAGKCGHHAKICVEGEFHEIQQNDDNPDDYSTPVKRSPGIFEVVQQAAESAAATQSALPQLDPGWNQNTQPENHERQKEAGLTADFYNIEINEPVPPKRRAAQLADGPPSSEPESHPDEGRTEIEGDFYGPGVKRQDDVVQVADEEIHTSAVLGDGDFLDPVPPAKLRARSHEEVEATRAASSAPTSFPATPASSVTKQPTPTQGRMELRRATIRFEA